MLYLVLASPLILVLLWYGYTRFSNNRIQSKRQRLMASPFPAAWRQILSDDFPLYRQLPTMLQRKLEAHIQIFLNEKIFKGCNGLEITDRIRVVIAAQACMLILNRKSDYFPGFETILVYPETYQAPVTEQDGHVHTETVSTRAGESWHRGPVVLAWNDVIQGAKIGSDGHNVVMHEFAHKLDEQDAAMDGTPILRHSSQYHSWVRVFSREYEDLVQNLTADHRHVIDKYAATSPAEFFAVVTEMFFEQPSRLLQRHPELYKELRGFYELDPANWMVSEQRPAPLPPHGTDATKGVKAIPLESIKPSSPR